MAFKIYDAMKAVQDLWRPQTTGANSQIIVAKQHFSVRLFALQIYTIFVSILTNVGQELAGESF